jgi:hypothetical protein
MQRPLRTSQRFGTMTPWPPSRTPRCSTSHPSSSVVVLQDVADAVPLACALVAGGLPAIEVILRTPAALDAIRVIAEDVPDAVVGAGTVIRPEAGPGDRLGDRRGALSRRLRAQV